MKTTYPSRSASAEIGGLVIAGCRLVRGARGERKDVRRRHDKSGQVHVASPDRLLGRGFGPDQVLAGSVHYTAVVANVMIAVVRNTLAQSDLDQSHQMAQHARRSVDT